MPIGYHGTHAVSPGHTGSARSQKGRQQPATFASHMPELPDATQVRPWSQAFPN